MLPALPRPAVEVPIFEFPCISMEEPWRDGRRIARDRGAKQDNVLLGCHYDSPICPRRYLVCLVVWCWSP
jgi:hypothetical protein